MPGGQAKFFSLRALAVEGTLSNGRDGEEPFGYAVLAGSAANIHESFSGEGLENGVYHAARDGLPRFLFVAVRYVSRAPFFAGKTEERSFSFGEQASL